MSEPDKIEAGCYKMQLVKRGVHVGVRLALSRPVEGKHFLDRSPRWLVLVDGEWSRREPYNIWTWCMGSPIPLAEYRFMLRRARHCRAHDPRQPWANPHEPVDWLKVPPPTWKGL